MGLSQETEQSLVQGSGRAHGVEDHPGLGGSADVDDPAKTGRDATDFPSLHHGGRKAELLPSPGQFGIPRTVAREIFLSMAQGFENWNERTVAAHQAKV